MGKKRVMPLEKRGITNSRIIFGCMKLYSGPKASPISEEDIKLAERAVDAALKRASRCLTMPTYMREGKRKRYSAKCCEEDRS